MSAKAKPKSETVMPRSGRLCVLVPLDEVKHVRACLDGLGPISLSADQRQRLQQVLGLVHGWQARPRRLQPPASGA